MNQAAAKLVEIICFSLRSSSEKRRLLYRYLSDDEKQRAARYRFDKHRHRFIAGRGAIREILAERAQCSPRDIAFELNEFGKPTLAEPGSGGHIQFNASSSAMLGAIAISDGIALGFDIEKIKSAGGVDNDLVVKNEFTRDEYDWYARHADSERRRIFYQFWTCKEAYLKALGVGLSGRLDSFSIDLTGRQPSVASTVLEPGGQSRLSLRQFDIAEEFIACLALPETDHRIEISNW